MDFRNCLNQNNSTFSMYLNNTFSKVLDKKYLYFRKYLYNFEII